MYYKLHSDLSLQAGYVVKKRNQNVSLITGAMIDKSDLKVLPWPFTVKPPRDYDLRLSDFYSGHSLMSNRLVASLNDSGVDNLQVFPAIITNTATQENCNDYSVVNVIGWVSCADEDVSLSTPLAHKQFFTKLVIDPSRTGDLLMFRLAESPMEILVHERLSKMLLEGNFIDLKLEPVEISTGARV